MESQDVGEWSPRIKGMESEDTENLTVRGIEGVEDGI